MEKTTVEVPERFYFHGNEVDNFIYIQIPKPLIKDKVFGSISDSAKVFYSLLLNRTGLSRKNSWVDENGRIYINYSIQNVVDEFDVGVAKAKSLFAELTDINGTGIGLIKKVRVAGAPSRIYVMNVKGVMNRLRELAQDEAYTDCSGTLEYYAQAESHSAADPMNPYYFRGDEADFFTYVPLPVQLVKNKVFRGMTASAKMLYALLLNRSGDPMHARKDNEGRVYVNYSIKDLEEQFGVQNRKAIMLFKELTDINGTGIGLIKRVRTANKPCRIYVMNFTQVYEYLAGSADEEIYESEPGADGCAQNRPKDVHEIDRRTCMKSTDGCARNQPTDVHEIDRWMCTETADGRAWNRPEDVHGNSRRMCMDSSENNNRFSNTCMSNNHLISSYPSDTQPDEEHMTKMDKMVFAREIIRENIEYDELSFRHTEAYRARLDELVEIMVEACVSDRDFYICGDLIPHNSVASVFFKYDCELMEYVMECIEGCTREVRNPKAYLLSTLYNAPKTINNHVRMQVNHSMYEKAE